MTPDLRRSDVEPNFKDNIGDCGCGCGLHGAYRVKLSRDGERHVRVCKCPRCMGKRNRQKGDRKAAQARRRLNLSGANTRHEEHWRGSLLIEAKAGAQVGPIWTRFKAARDQAEAARAIGDLRPFVMVAAADRAPILLVLDINDVLEVAAAILDDWSES